MTQTDVVIVSYNSRDHLREAVEPLSRLSDVEVIIVDNASADGSLDAVSDLAVTLLPQPDNRGFAHGCNIGWREGSAPFVLFLNPDAELDETSLRRLVCEVNGDEGVGAAGPRILESDGTLDFSQRRFPRLRSTYAQALFLHRLAPQAPWSDELVRDPAAYEQPGSPDWISGACLLVRRSALERLGGFDERFFLYCEDLDLCRRLRDDGIQIRYVPDAVCVHAGGASAPRPALLPVLAESRLRYARKYLSRRAAAFERLGIGLGALTHAALARGGAQARRGHLRAFARAARGG